MSLINNQSFITQILRAQGCEQSKQQAQTAIQILVELETRKFIETIKKFARQDRRDYAQSSDVEQALKYMGHGDICLLIHQPEQYKKDSSHSQYIRLDPIIRNPTKFIEQEQYLLNTTYAAPKLKGRWIYINGKIPKTNDNSTLRSLSDMRNIIQHQEEEKKKKFNIIRDDPMSLLAIEHRDYYNQITAELLSTQQPSNPAILKPQGNIKAVFPFLMKFLLNVQICNKKIQFFLNMLENSYIATIIEGNLHQILSYLMSYFGQYSFAVGLKIGEIVKKFNSKYPALFDIFVRESNQLKNKASKKLQQTQIIKIYSSLIKQIAFELSCGVPLHLAPQLFNRCKDQSYGSVQKIQMNKEEQNGVKLFAQLSISLLAEYWGQLKCTRQNQLGLSINAEFYWCPSMQGRTWDDGFMMMNI